MRISALLIALLLVGAFASPSHSACDPQGRPPWDDIRAQTDRHAIVREAKAGIDRHLQIGRFADNLEVLYTGDGCGNGADGCFIRTPVTTETRDHKKAFKCVPTGYCRVWVDPWTGCRYTEPIYERRWVWEPYATTSTMTRRQISISDCLFQRGWLNLDPTDKVFWDASFSSHGLQDDDNLYYKFAKDVIEAVQFTILHELAHVRGVEAEAEADFYARNMVLELRKASRGLPASFYLPGNRQLAGYTSAIRLACIAQGPPPPLADLPPGSR